MAFNTNTMRAIQVHLARCGGGLSTSLVTKLRFRSDCVLRPQVYVPPG